MKIKFWVYFAILSIANGSTSHEYDLKEKNTLSGYIPGDYVIGALFPIRTNFDDDNFKCVDIDDYDAIQAVEAAYFAIDKINSDDSILPNVTLGIDIKDYYYSIEAAILQTKKLVDKSVSRSNATEDIFSPIQKDIHSPLIGIIGPDCSVISFEVQSILKFFRIVQIDYSEPITDFVNRPMDFYPYFLSIIPGNAYMTETIVQVLESFNWTYVSLIHSTDSFGISGMKHFQKLAAEKGICIADVIETDHIKEAFSNDRINNNSYSILDIMPSYQEVDVIICYCSPLMMNFLYEEIGGHGHLTKRFVVIGGDGWPPRQSNRKRNKEVAIGELSISLKQSYIREFDEYFVTRNLQNNQRNPWFKEFWQNYFHCSINPENGSKTCNGSEELGEDYEQNPKVPHIIKSIYVLAHALDDMLKSGCHDRSGELPMENIFNKSCYMAHVKTVNFSFYGDTVNFAGRLPSVIKYDIHNFQQLPDGTFDYVLVGKFVESNNHKVLQFQKDIQFPQNKTSVKSTCNEPCSPRHAKVLRKDKCCWDCVLCKPFEVLGNSTQCVTCKHGFMSNENKTECIAIPLKRMKWNSQEMLIPFSLSVISLISVLFIFYLFIINRNTPAVRSTTKELCYIIFIGMILANFTPFLAIHPPNEIICSAIRIAPAISFTMMYGSLAVKMNRIARIFAESKKKFPNLNLPFLSSKAQIVITCILIIIEACFCVNSLLKNSPEPYIVFQTNVIPYYGVELCPMNENTIVDTFAFVTILIVSCTYYARKIRNLPENFNEAKYIEFAMYATDLTYIAFMLIYFSIEMKVLAICLCVSINSLIMLICLFGPKLHILCKPNKNTRANTTSTNIRNFIGKESRSNKNTKMSLEQRFNKNSISLETITTEISITR